jgi:mannose-6-phosphate isomerase
MLYPLTFRPIFKQRVWGGRDLEHLYRKPLPASLPIGESWEIADRPDDVSVIDNGPLAGCDLRWLMDQHRNELLGAANAPQGKFPLLIKILDARHTLSVQVHPPARQAARLGGEPKTELWYIAAAAPDAKLFVGLKRGVSRADFEIRIRNGSVAECLHSISVKAGDAMFLPSGRVHAIGAGLVIFEIQQNSDTTYRVFDWNRAGLDGKPRPLHIAESLASIDFDDFEPAILRVQFNNSSQLRSRPLVNDPLFTVELAETQGSTSSPLKHGRMQILGGLSGRLTIRSGPSTVSLGAGQFCLLPACLPQVIIQSEGSASFLRIEAGD